MRRSWRRAESSYLRAILSDVLPYELPVAFSNAEFYRWARRLDLRWDRENVTARWVGPETPVLLAGIFGSNASVVRVPGAKRVSFVDRGLKPTVKGKLRSFPRSIPYKFEVAKPGGGMRELAVMHPRLQISVARFYEEHADTLLYLTSRSSFSIRRPTRRARYSAHRDALFEEVKDDDARGVEESGREYDALRSYFVYENYAQVYRFYDSAEMRLLERRYSLLRRLDVVQCFDSIYTHSISWVINGLASSKLHMAGLDGTVGGRLDRLMQAMNYDETHGILVGPEFSRVFAEILLQEVDVRVERELSSRGLEFRRDYEVRRFVDDYFVFAQTETDLDLVEGIIAAQLRAIRLNLNPAKSLTESTPLQSRVSVAKRRVEEVFKRHIQLTDSSDAQDRVPRPTISVEGLLLAYKGVLLDCGVEHDDVANYALVRLEIEVERALNPWRTKFDRDSVAPPSDKEWVDLVRFIMGCADSAFGILGGGRYVSQSVKVARITFSIDEFCKRVSMPFVYGSQVRSRFARELAAQVLRGSRPAGLSMHSFVLLDCLTALGPDHQLTDAQMRKIMAMNGDDPQRLDAVALLTLLRHCADSQSLGSARADLEEWAMKRLLGADMSIDTEALLLASALLGSPFAARATVVGAAEAVGLGSSEMVGPQEFSPLQFAWVVDDYHGALQQKRGLEVY